VNTGGLDNGCGPRAAEVESTVLQIVRSGQEYRMFSSATCWHLDAPNLDHFVDGVRRRLVDIASTDAHLVSNRELNRPGVSGGSVLWLSRSA
jgi:hypothetical protein